MCQAHTRATRINNTQLQLKNSFYQGNKHINEELKKCAKKVIGT
jgi:hypothetical protein